MFNSEYKFNIIPNPIIKFLSITDGDYAGVNEIKRETPIIVSITSDEDNFSSLELSLYSLLNQTVKPDRLILWLSDDEYDLTYLPYSITRYIKNGLEIKFVKDIGSYTNPIYPLEQFYNSINVIANDSVYYNKNWLMKLYHSYIASPKDIQTHNAHQVDLSLPFSKWKKNINEENAEYNYYPSSLSGVLYPPKCFSKEVFRDDIFVKNNITNPDVWLWVMGILSNRKIRIVKNHNKRITSTNIFKYIFEDKNKKYSQIDTQISKLMEFYGQNILPKLK